ncbi:hypothetical protein SLE2022_333780 [Rubroshorea leprosula]
MKSSSFSTIISDHCRLLISLLLFLIVLFPSLASTTRPKNLTSAPRKHIPSLLLRHHSCSSFPHANPRSLCFQLQGIQKRGYFSPPPPPPPSLKEIDPRYGAEKRLVPSGPNPLHN